MNVVVKPTHISFGHLVDYPKENFGKLLFYVSTIVVTVVLLTVIQLITEASTHQREGEREIYTCVCVCTCMHAMYVEMLLLCTVNQQLQNILSMLHPDMFVRALVWGGQ